MGGVIGEILRRAQLAQQLGLTGGQGGQPQDQNQAPQVQQPSNQKDQALNSYRQALQEPAPTYNPSFRRKLIGGILGGVQGITNPQAGSQLAQQITHAPYERELTDYQRRLAQKKEAFETEQGAQKESSLEEEQKARVGAESERAKAETARKLEEEGKLRVLQPGTPEFEGEQQKLKIQHPNTPKLPSPFELELNNGEKIPVAYEDQNGQYKDTEGNIYGSSTIKSARKIGTNTPKGTQEKPPREGEAGAIDQWTLEHGREPNYSERLAIHRQYADKPVDSSAKDIANEFKLQSAKTSAARTYERNRDLATGQLDRLDRAITEVNSSKPVDLALSIPTILTALVSGQNTGVRITKDEMNKIIHARGWGESIEAFVSKIQGLGDLSAKQKSDLKGLLSDVQKKVSERQREYADTADEIYNSDDLKGINNARIKANKRLTGGSEELPGGITLDDINKELERRKKK